MVRSPFTRLRVCIVAACSIFTISAHAQMVWNQAANFDGTSYLALPFSAWYNFNGDFTLESWVKTTSTQVVTILGRQAYRFMLDDGRGRMQINGITRLTGNRKVNDGQWHHIACVYLTRGGTTEIVVDGTLDTLVSAVPQPDQLTDSLFIGWGNTGSGPIALDEVRMWYRGLSVEEIYRNMHLSIALGEDPFQYLVLSLPFQSTNGVNAGLDLRDYSMVASSAVNHGAGLIEMSGTPSLYISPNASLFLDGGKWSYAVTPGNPNLPAMNSFTIEAWIYPLHAAGGSLQPIVSRLNPDNTGYELDLLSNGRLGFTTEDGVAPTTVSIPDSQWTHVAATYSYNGDYPTESVYINGKRNGTFAGFTITAVSDSLYIGCDPQVKNHFAGYIDELRLSSYAKTEDQIRQDLYTGIDYMNRPSPSNVELVYGFDGSSYPSTLNGPALTLRAWTWFSSPSAGDPVSPLDRDPASGTGFPDGYYLRTANRLFSPQGAFSHGSIMDSLFVSGAVSISNVNLFLAFDYSFPRVLDITLFSPSGDSVEVWRGNGPLPFTDGVATVLADYADSSMSSADVSFSPRIRPAVPLNPAFANTTSAGLWRLRIASNSNNYPGELYAWGLQFNNQSLVSVATTPAALPARYVLEAELSEPVQSRNSDQRTVDSGQSSEARGL